MAMALASFSWSSSWASSSQCRLPVVPTFQIAQSLRFPLLMSADRHVACYVAAPEASELKTEEEEEDEDEETSTTQLEEDAQTQTETENEAAELVLPQQKIRVRLKAYFPKEIEAAMKMILDAAKSTGASTMAVPLPTKRKLFCFLRSPFADKDSREHLEIRTHKRLIDIKNPNPRTIDALMKLDIPAGVDVEVKL